MEGVVRRRLYQRVARTDGRRVVVVVEVRLRERGGGGAPGAHGGLRADERLHALQRGGRLPAHEVAAHQRLQLHERLERAQRLLRLRTQRRSSDYSKNKTEQKQPQPPRTNARTWRGSRAATLLDSIGSQGVDKERERERERERKKKVAADD